MNLLIHSTSSKSCDTMLYATDIESLPDIPKLPRSIEDMEGRQDQWWNFGYLQRIELDVSNHSVAVPLTITSLGLAMCKMDKEHPLPSFETFTKEGSVSILLKNFIDGRSWFKSSDVFVYNAKLEPVGAVTNLNFLSDVHTNKTWLSIVRLMEGAQLPAWVMDTKIS